MEAENMGNNQKSSKWMLMAVAAVVVVGGGAILLNQKEYSKTANTNIQETVQSSPESNNPDKKVLRIVSGESIAKYELNELLNGKPTHVVGTTEDIAGDIYITTNSPQKIEIGEIKLDARTFKTDIAKRDENVINLVLKSSDPANEFIIFKTTGITGLPETMELNKDFPIAIAGDITIMGITKPVIFDGGVNLSDDNALNISASAMLNYEDFGVKIPDFSFLANVDKTVKLSVSLVAI